MEFFHKILEKRLSVTLPKHGLLRDLIIQFGSLGIKSSPFSNIRAYCSIFTHLNFISCTHTSVT